MPTLFRLRTLFAPLLLCLVAAAPSHALTFSTSGPGLAPCGAQLCVDVDWRWEGQTAVSAGQVDFTLPTPDPALWELSSGRVTRVGGTARVGGWFHTSELDLEPGEPRYVGQSTPEYLLVGADGSTLARSLSILVATCFVTSPPAEPETLCGDFNGTASQTDLWTDVDAGDAAAFNGPLTLRYDYENTDWEIDPIRLQHSFDLGGSFRLVYSAVPEPGTGLLVMTGLLGLAYRQRRQRRAA